MFWEGFFAPSSSNYAELLGMKMIERDVKVWLANTGWIGRVYGIGNRMKFSLKRSMIRSAQIMI